MARAMDNIVLAKELETRAERLKNAFNEEFWMKDKKFFALALDGDKKQVPSITSNPGHLLFTGIVDNRRVLSVVKRLFKKDLFTSCGIRNHSELEPDFNSESYDFGAVWPHDNWIIAQGLKNWVI